MTDSRQGPIVKMYTKRRPEGKSINPEIRAKSQKTRERKKLKGEIKWVFGRQLLCINSLGCGSVWSLEC